MDEGKTVIWFGSVFSEYHVLGNQAVSPAANRWQHNFIRSITDSGYNVINIGHCPERVFPFGKLFVNKKDSISPPGINLISSSFLNLPVLRLIEINLLSVIKVANLFRRSKNRPLIAVSYNTYAYNILPILFVRYFKKIRWITIIADPMFANSDLTNPINLLADIKVFLSFKLFQESRSKRKFHFDGGISRINGLDMNLLNNNDEKIILYTGALEKYAGIELLLEAFSLINDNEVRLIICGKGNNDRLRRSLQSDKRISFLGMVAEQQLVELSQKAYLFINPRLINDKSNHSNFPSKILEYLSFCKPVISTFTDGINPDYKQVIEFVYSDDPVELAGKIKQVISWDKSQYIEVSEKIRRYNTKYKIWPLVVSEFSKWMAGFNIISDSVQA